MPDPTRTTAARGRFQPRPTTYCGIPMRSRLEALWAAHFDNEPDHGPWLYEPRCFASPAGQYLPDFVMLDDPLDLASAQAFVEVKPRILTASQMAAEQRRMSIIWDSMLDVALSLYMGPPDDYLWLLGDRGIWESEPIECKADA